MLWWPVDAARGLLDAVPRTSPGRRAGLSSTVMVQDACNGGPISNFHQLQVIFEDDDYFFVSKPSGLSVVGEAGKGGFHELVKEHAVREYSHQPNLLHRLDKGTSGVMVYAKSADAAKHYLKLQDVRAAITKDYLAIVAGVPPKPAGRIAGGIYASRDRRSFVVGSAKSGKRVLTTYRLLGSQEDSTLGTLSKLSLRLFTGRKHQIRASCRKLGCPIVGDVQYGGPPHARIHLHAHRVAFGGSTDVVYDVSCLPSWSVGPDDLDMGASAHEMRSRRVRPPRMMCADDPGEAPRGRAGRSAADEAGTVPRGRGRGRGARGPPARRVTRDGRGQPVRQRRGGRGGGGRGGRGGAGRVESPTKKPVVGQRVAVLQKRDYTSGVRTIGVVADVLTRAAQHSRGFKVRLHSGEVGRCVEILSCETPQQRNDARGTLRRGASASDASFVSGDGGPTAAELLAMPLEQIVDPGTG